MLAADLGCQEFKVLTFKAVIIDTVEREVLLIALRSGSTGPRVEAGF